jgi:hypothetical protein
MSNRNSRTNGGDKKQNYRVGDKWPNGETEGKKAMPKKQEGGRGGDDGKHCPKGKEEGRLFGGTHNVFLCCRLAGANSIASANWP